jgi:hypothetical protein
MYIIASVVICYFAGTNVALPAFDQTLPVVRKVAYGVAMQIDVVDVVVLSMDMWLSNTYA